MEEKDSPFSGSPGISETESPPALMPEMAPKVAAVDGERGFLPSSTMISATERSGGGGGGSGSGDFLMKKKRGRPRKYDSDGNLSLAYQKMASPDGFSLSPTSPSEFSSKKGRGRGAGSGNWQLLASLGELFANTAGGDFTPHVVTVNTGEDVAAKILSFSQKGPRGICVLSANGAVSNVTIRQPGSSGGILTYEGRFEILSLSGSFTVTDSDGMKSRTGGLSVSLAGPDGRVIGGGIAGLLMAASPIQIVVGSFVPNSFKTHKRKNQREYAMSPPIRAVPEPVSSARPISQANPDSEICLAPSTGQTNGEVDRLGSDKHNLNFPSENTSWTISAPSLSDQRHSPDINISMSFGEQN